MPLTIKKYGYIPGIEREIICRGLKPKFLIEPSELEFKRKIISSPDKNFSASHEILLKNPENRTVSWSLDISSIKSEKIFFFS